MLLAPVIFAAACLPSTSRGGDVRALLIGVSDYIDPEVADPIGAENDVAAMEQLLQKRLGIAKDSIKSLTGHKATREAILAGITDWLVAGGSAQTNRLLYFSGHGSWRDDDNGDETEDRRDEVLCPSDYVKKTGANGIIDDELGVALKGIPAGRLLVVTDACHSGSATKCVSGELRVVPTKSLGKTQTRMVEPPSAGAKSLTSRKWNSTKGITTVFDMDHTHLSACRDFQLAKGAHFLRGGKLVAHGALTYCLTRGLGGAADANADGTITYAELDRYVDKMIGPDGLGFDQKPELRGGNEVSSDAVLGLQGGWKSAIRKIDNGSKIEIPRGVMDGLAPGSRVVLRAQDRGITPGVAVIEAADMLTATARFDPESPAIGSVDSSAVYSVEVVRQVDPELTIWVGSFFDNGREAIPPVEITGAIRQLPGVRVVDSYERARLFVAGVYAGNQCTVFLMNPSDRILASHEGTIKVVVEKLTRSIEIEAMKHELMRLEPTDGPAQVSLRTVTSAGEPSTRVEYVAHPRDSSQDPDELWLELSANQDGYFVLFSVDSQGKFCQLWPNKVFGDDRNTAIRAGEKLRIPKGATGFFVRPPAGRDMIKAIWTPNPLVINIPGAKSLEDCELESVKETRDVVDSLSFAGPVVTTGSKGFEPESTSPQSTLVNQPFAASTVYIESFDPQP